MNREDVRIVAATLVTTLIYLAIAGVGGWLLGPVLQAMGGAAVIAIGLLLIGLMLTWFRVYRVVLGALGGSTLGV